MINPSVVELLEKVEDRYSLVIVTSKRARQLIDGAEELVDADSIKPLTIAINEVNEGAVSYKTQGLNLDKEIDEDNE
jgi:DNA-directed RNA polymerase subunit omega